MHLKQITILGFKSFAEKVVFDFAPGVTCIVGPNGCGKSNVVDAFRWVLGEQSARSLRGRQMSDMIFNGSATRRSSSVAQVDLVFDNTGRTLATDFDDVIVTRKLYRSGESEYQLNGESVRLKDLRELLMDTGIGVNAYSVIEQGRVDALLQSNPVERRIIFEEAAGVSKYKARRREAERKLERTQQNLLRVDDVIGELEKRLRSVKLQAGKARSYREHEARLNELRSSYAMAEYHRISQEHRQFVQTAGSSEDRVVSARAQISKREADETELIVRLDALAEAINAADGDFIRVKSELLSQEERITAADERSAELGAQLERITERRASDRERLEDGCRKLSELQAQEGALDQQIATGQTLVDHLSEQDQSLAREATRVQAALEDEKAGVIDLLRRSAQFHNEIIRLNTHRESLVGQKGRLSERDVVITSQLTDTLEKKAALATRIKQLDMLIAEETEKLEEKKSEAARTLDLKTRIGAEFAQAKEERSALVSRADLLQDLQHRREGVGQAVQRLLDDKEAGSGPPVLEFVVGLVADLFDADVEHAKIIEAALGDASGQLILTDSQRFFADVSSLGELPGRLTVLCEDRLGPLINVRDFSDRPGFVARAIDLVRFAESHDFVARHLLGKTIVMQTLDDAIAAAATDVDAHRFVTMTGEVVEPDGCVTIGSSSSSGGIMSRKSELRAIRSNLEELDKKIDDLGDQLNRSGAELEHLEEVQQELRAAVYESNTAKVEANAGLAAVQETVNRLTLEQPLIAHEVAMLEQQILDYHTKSEEGGKSIQAIEDENQERESAISDRENQLIGLVDRRMVIQEKLTQAKIDAGQLVEKRVAGKEQRSVLDRSIRDIQSILANAQKEEDQCVASIAEARKNAEEGRSSLAQLHRRTDILQDQCATLRRDRENLRRESEDLSQTVKTLRTELDLAESELHRIEMSLAESKVRLEELIRRTLEEMSIDLRVQYEKYEHQEQDWAQVEEEITDLRAKMTRLGNVNLDAITELDDLEKRHSFLTTQREDLTQSTRQLEQLIEKLNLEACDRFKETFDKIRENFRTLFRKLFGGGRADIVLEDPEQILECGIEIFAQPPGKELQSITLMSGGEKSMTAIALLMSIFRCRPAPCSLLDEVDAALDEANNERFNRIVQEFVKETQFIIVTHSKWTMNMADRLYGITMQEPGVSTLVSVELSDTNVA